jgi:pyruvate/2-oxoacid:ferredoxin oxidoreductase beta subunit
VAIEEIDSGRGKTLAEMKMARDREVWKRRRKEPRRCNGTKGNEKEEGDEKSLTKFMSIQTKLRIHSIREKTALRYVCETYGC